MKIIISILLVFTFFTGCLMYNQNQLKKLMINNPDIEIALNSILNEELKYLDVKKSIFLFIISKYGNEIEIRIALIDKQELRIEPKNKPYGFFEYKNVTGFIFGNMVDSLFTLTKEKRSFSYLKERRLIETKNNDQPPLPPNVVEPEVWKYIFVNNRMNFVKVSREHVL